MSQELINLYPSFKDASGSIQSYDHEAIQDAINKLPERCREIFVLSKVDGLSNKQIAEQLNISMKTVEAQMTTAFVRLRKELGWLLCFIFIQNF